MSGLDRSTLGGIALGVLALLGVAGFTVGLPEAVGDSSSDTHDRLPAEELLPPTLVSGALEPIGKAIPQVDQANADKERQTADLLTSLFDDDAAFRIYAVPSLEQLVSLTILDRSPGLFQPDGPPEAPAPEDQKAGTNEMVRYGDVVCAISWGAEKQLQETGTPAKVQCQRGYDGRTFEIYAKGLTADQTAAALNEAVAYAEERQDQ